MVRTKSFRPFLSPASTRTNQFIYFWRRRWCAVCVCVPLKPSMEQKSRTKVITTQKRKQIIWHKRTSNTTTQWLWCDSYFIVYIFSLFGYDIANEFAFHSREGRKKWGKVRICWCLPSIHIFILYHDYYPFIFIVHCRSMPHNAHLLSIYFAFVCVFFCCVASFPRFFRP